jgi:hypothetical protein
MSISSAAPAYQAAVLIRDHSLPWLDVVDATNTVIGSVDREALDDTFKLLHLAPYFGEEMMAAILPPLQPAELEPI